MLCIIINHYLKQSQIEKLSKTKVNKRFIYYMSMLQYYFEDRRDEFTEQIKLYDMTRMFNAIVNKKPEVFEVELNNLLLDTISFNDAYENFYHGFLARVISNMKVYIVKSNREGGTGRNDSFKTWNCYSNRV